jgi:cytochrome c556
MMMKSMAKKLFICLLSISLLLPALAASAATSATSNPAADLRATLGKLLSEHALLAMIAMQKGYDGAADFNDAAGALGKNTEALTGAITSVFGEEAGTAFNGLWTAHIGFFVDYVVATGKKDEAGRKAALDKLGNYKNDFAKFLSGATNIPEGKLAEGLQMHVDHLVGAFDSYVAKDYKKTYKHFRVAYEHMFGTADALAGAIAKNMPEKFSGDGFSDAVDLRIALDRLLAEHAALAMLAMQKGIDGAADFNDVAGALNENTNDLTGAIASVFGKDAGTAFNGLWSAHIGFFVDYVLATGGNDAAGKTAALDQLSNYKQDFAKFLSGATKIPEGDLASGLQMHVDQLVSAFDSYVAKDYATTYESFRSAFDHMMMTADALAGAIVANMASEMPKKMPKTGMGGTSSDTNTGAMIWAVALALAGFVAGGMYLRRGKV